MVCLAVMDIWHHYGPGQDGKRAAAIDKILKSEADPGKAFARILRVGSDATRIKTVTVECAKLTKAGNLGILRYSQFV